MLAGQNRALVAELARLQHAVVREGQTSERIYLEGAAGGWREAVDAVNGLIQGSMLHGEGITRVVRAVAEGELTPEEALVARVELVSAYRRFPFRDPQLPTALQPDGWPGDEAYETFVRAHQALAGPATSYVSSVLTVSARTTTPSLKTIA